MRHAVLERVADLSDGAFEQIISLLLERMGHEAIRVVHRGAGVVAMLTRRDDETVAVVARRGRTTVGADTVEALEGNLPRFDAALGILLTVGRFDDKARAAGRRGGVRLVDGQGLSRLLYTHGVGFARHQPIVRYVDAALFASLG
ncbi:MAG: restriction endonuclease [bacterium]